MEIHPRNFSVQSTSCQTRVSYTKTTSNDRHFQELTERYLLLLLASFPCSPKHRLSESFCAIGSRRSKGKKCAGTKCRRGVLIFCGCVDYRIFPTFPPIPKGGKIGLFGAVLPRNRKNSDTTAWLDWRSDGCSDGFHSRRSD